MDLGTIYNLLQKVQNLDEFMMYNNAIIQIEEENLLNIIHTLSNHDVEDQYLRARIKGMRCFG